MQKCSFRFHITYKDRKEKYVRNDIAMCWESGIIKENKTESDNKAVHIVGKIDRKIYGCITENIITDEVIITDERIEHIKERHPNDYERYYSYISKIIAEPDYIIEANKPNTGVLLKEIETSNERFKLVLRLAISKDPQYYKNSVISFWLIGETTWKKSLKNKKILYKKE